MARDLPTGIERTASGYRTLLGEKPRWVSKRPVASAHDELHNVEMFRIWCARQDSNLRPTAPEAVALSS